MTRGGTMSSEGRAKTYRDAVLHFQAFDLTLRTISM